MRAAQVKPVQWLSQQIPKKFTQSGGYQLKKSTHVSNLDAVRQKWRRSQHTANCKRGRLLAAERNMSQSKSSSLKVKHVIQIKTNSCSGRVWRTAVRMWKWTGSWCHCSIIRTRADPTTVTFVYSAELTCSSDVCWCRLPTALALIFQLQPARWFREQIDALYYSQRSAYFHISQLQQVQGFIALFHLCSKMIIKWKNE